MTLTQAAPEPDETGPGGHRYNDDLLISESARHRAQREHARLYHVLDHEALRLEFGAANERANVRKRSSQVAGVWAVIGALLSLLGGASAPLWHSLHEPWPIILGGSSAFLGLAAFAIAGIGLIYGKRKAQWLEDRLCTERLRQYYFQTFLFHLPKILESLRGHGENKYREQRGQWFDSFLDRLKTKKIGSVDHVTDSERIPDVWLHSAGMAPVWHASSECPELQLVFKAYYDLRFMEQEGYADYVLRRENDSSMPAARGRWPWRHYPGMLLPLKVKRAGLARAWWFALGVLALLHVTTLLGCVPFFKMLQGSWVHLGILSAALVAVAAKTLAEGLALTQEIERYEEYRAIVSDLARRFRERNCPSEDKFRLMVTLEQASYEEMRAFLRSHREAKFVM